MNKDYFYWDQTKDERLVELVKLIPELYDVNSPKYNDTIAKRNGWQKIGAAIMLESYKCEERWEYLKAVQRRDAKEARSGQTGSPSTDWKIKNQMFCNEFRQNKRKSFAVDLPNKIKQTKTASNGDEQTAKTFDVVKTDPQVLEGTDLRINKPEEVLSPTNINLQANSADHENASKDSTNENSPTPVVDQGKSENVSPHSIDVFFLLMANLVKSFNTIDQHLIKVKLFELVHKTEAKYILSQNLIQHNSFINPSRNSSVSHSPLMMPPSSNSIPQVLPNQRVSELQNNPYDSFYNSLN